MYKDGKTQFLLNISLKLTRTFLYKVIILSIIFIFDIFTDKLLKRKQYELATPCRDAPVKRPFYRDTQVVVFARLP